MKILNDLKKSGQSPISDGRGYVVGHKSFFIDKDAETYFEWLVAAVTGGEENVSEDIVKQTNNQLFQIMHILSESIHMEKTVQLLSPYNWQELFISFDQKLTDVRNVVDKGEKDIAETLSKILVWMKKYTPTLDRLEKENDELFGKGNKQ